MHMDFVRVGLTMTVVLLVQEILQNTQDLMGGHTNTVLECLIATQR